MPVLLGGDFSEDSGKFIWYTQGLERDINETQAVANVAIKIVVPIEKRTKHTEHDLLSFEELLFEPMDFKLFEKTTVKATVMCRERVRIGIDVAIPVPDLGIFDTQQEKQRSSQQP